MMTPERIDVIVREDPANRQEVVLGSPAVGHFSSAPRVGEVVVGGSQVGCLTSLGRRIDLVVPRGVTGRVAEVKPANRSDPVDYGHELIRLLPVEASTGSDPSAVSPDGGSEDLPEGTLAVCSSIHGMFYRRPRPDDLAYVEIGQVVEEGTTLGLVEVMKCFSAIVYGGPDLPSRAEIVEVRVDDGAEVEADQILFVVRPA
jgi:acetyl-CoA carboxylase biotin carboxyl carrier protein